MDGEITIGTKLETDKFDRQVADLEKKMKKTEDKKIVIESKLGSQQDELEKARQETDKLADAYQRLKETQDRLATGKATPQEFTTFQDLQNTYGSLEQLGASFDKALTKQDAIEQKVNTTKLRYEEINDKVAEYNQKIESVKLEKQVSEANRLKESFNGVGSSIQKSITNVARLALGVFGVRSAYLALRRASSDLASYDKQYAANIEYIRYALTQAIAPVLQWIVRLAATLLGYINAILQGWFGINLFSRGSAENFNKMKASTGGISKAVKEIKKQLAGFDEVNMLTDQSDTGTSAGAGGVGAATPDFDLSNLQSEPPEWLKWIIDNKDIILAVLAGIGAGILALKLKLGGLMALGIGIAVAGIVKTVQAIVKFIKDPSWQNFGKILEGLALVLAGVAIAMLAVNAANPLAWILLVIAAVAALVAVVIKYWNQIKNVFAKVGQWFMEHVIKPVGKFFQGMWDGIKNIFAKVGEWFYKAFTAARDNIKKAFSTIGSFFQSVWNKVKEIFSKVGSFFKSVFTTAYNGIKNVFSNIGTFFSGIWGKIVKVFKNIGQKVGDVMGKAFKNAINSVLKAVESILNVPIKAINGLISVINAVPGINLGYLNTFSLPRLASGGIVNMPNRGTLVGGAIAGESGREGVIPLTDQQTMAELGREIGKNVLVNLTNITTMNGRVIGRELKQVQSEQEFAFNS